MQATTLNIAILPSDEVIAQAIAMSRQISDELASRFLLSSNTAIPHITVYQARYPNKNMDKVKNIARNLALEQKVFEIELDTVTISHGTFLFWNCERTLVLRKLQKKTVELASSLREGLIPNSLADAIGLSEGDKYDVKTFGALLIGPRYKPHITITRLKREEDAHEAIKVLGDAKKISFNPKALILGYLGAHGTVTEIAESFRFK